MRPKVSVIIPTYNRRSNLYSAIRSVLSQTYEYVEIMVVDDASTDDTKETIDKFDDNRIYYIRHKENKGGGAARNTGIENSRGEFIAFLDDDDVWTPMKLEKQLNLITKNPAIGVVYTGTQVVNKKNRTIGITKPWLRGNIFSKLLKRNYVGSCSEVLVRKECLDSTGFFDENLPAFQDWDMWIRLARHYQFDYISEPLIRYTVHKNRISNRPFARLQAARVMFEKFSRDLNTQVNRREILGYWYYRFGRIYSECGDMRKGRKEFVKAMSKDPYNVVYSIRLLTSFFGQVFYRTLSRSLGSNLPSSFKSKLRAEYYVIAP